MQYTYDEAVRELSDFHKCTAQEIVLEWKTTINLLEEHNGNNV